MEKYDCMNSNSDTRARDGTLMYCSQPAVQGQLFVPQTIQKDTEGCTGSPSVHVVMANFVGGALDTITVVNSFLLRQLQNES